MASSLVISARQTLTVAHRRGCRRRMVIASFDGAGLPPKLVTFLGKGGSGKTTVTVVAAQELADKTDIVRLPSPSLLKLVYDAARPNGKTREGRLSTDIWNEIEQLLEYRGGLELLIEAKTRGAS